MKFSESLKRNSDFQRAYIEETARNDFGYVREGEIHFHFASMDVLRGYTEAEWNALLDEFRD